MKQNVAAVLASRMSSHRLPGKPLISYTSDNRPNIECIADRVLSSRHNITLIVATSTDKSDDPIQTWYRDYETRYAGPHKIALHCGDLENVVSRLDSALKRYTSEAKYIWRVMGDCPLVDVRLADWRIDVLARTNSDMVTILQPEPTYAAQASIWSREAWDYCARMSSGSLLEHPGEYLYEHYGELRTLREIGPESVYYLPIRTELDTLADLEFFRKVWQEFPERDRGFLDVPSILTWLETRPDIVSVNSGVEMKTKSTHEHGHRHARNFVCKGCSSIMGHKINDALELQCPKCGQARKFYV